MQTRYEEYHHTQGQIPFVLNDDLKRTVTLYSESRNWHENIEIQYCKVGEGFVVIDGTRYAFAKGDIAVIDSNSIHYTFSDTSMVYSCIIVGNEFWKQMGMDYNRFSFAPVVKDERVCCIFEEICDAYKGESELRVATLNYLLLKLLIEIVRGYSTPRTVEKTEKKDLITVKKVLLYIRENYNKKITLDLIATHALIDKYTLCKVFKKVTNQTVFENMNAFRCIKAAEYISDGKSVSEAALLCGFENHSFFTKMFKRYVGVKPSEYRSALQ